jgi:hypothetical protein
MRRVAMSCARTEDNVKIHILSNPPLSKVETQLVGAAIHHYRITAIQTDALYLLSGAIDAIKGSKGMPDSPDVRHAFIKKRVESFVSMSFDGLTIALEWEPEDFVDPIRNMN